MKIDSTLFDQIVRLVADLAGTDQMKLQAVEIFSGPTPLAGAPIIRFVIVAAPGTPPLREVTTRLAASFPAIFGKPDQTAGDDEPADAPSLAALVARLAVGLMQRRWAFDLVSGARASADGGEGWFEYLIETIGYQALSSALIAVGAALGDRGDPAAASARQRASLNLGFDQAGPDLNSQTLIAAARKRGIPVIQITSNKSLWQFGWGDRSERFWFTASNADGMVGNRIAADREVGKRLFRQLSIPTPASMAIGPNHDLRGAAEAIGWPCVVKPLTLGRSFGAVVDIRDAKTLASAVAQGRKRTDTLMLEAQQPGSDHRLIVIDGRLVAAIRKEPPSVTGDGRRTIAELMTALNASRRAGYLRQVADDETLAATLAAQGVSRASVLGPGAEVRLMPTASWWTGGSGIDVLDQVHPQIKAVAELLAGTLRLRAVGIDYMTTDIGRSPDDVGGGFLEANPVVGLDLPLAVGMDADALAEQLLGPKPGQIPVNLLLAPTDLHPVIEPMLRAQLSDGIGLTAPGCMQIGSFVIPRNELPPHIRPIAMLRYTTVQRLVVLWRPEDLANCGLPVASLHAAVVLGPQPPAAWVEVIGRHARRVHSCDEPAEAVALSLDMEA